MALRELNVQRMKLNQYYEDLVEHKLKLKQEMEK